MYPRTDESAQRTPPRSPAEAERSIGFGLIAGAALGLLLLSRVLFDGDLALGVAAGAGLGLLITVMVKMVRREL